MAEPTPPAGEEKGATASDSLGAERALADAGVPGSDAHLAAQSAAPASPLPAPTGAPSTGAAPAPSPAPPQPQAEPLPEHAAWTPEAPSGPRWAIGQLTEEAPGTTIVHTGRDGYLDLCAALKADGFAMMIGVSGVDYLTHPGRRLPEQITAERFEVVVELLSLISRRRVRVRCQVPESDPRVPTLFDLWPGAEGHEREVYDLFGVVFDDHPDMTRILMPEDWEGHPLRKDYATGHVPVQFKEAPSGR